MKIASFPGMFAHRYPLWSPDEDGGETVDADLDPAFVEQPGDREPDPEAERAGAEETTEEPEATEEAEEEPGAEAEETTAEEEPEEEEQPKKKDWRDRQIIKLRAQEKKDREEKAAKDAEIARLTALAEGDPDKADALKVDPDKIRAEALETVRREQRFQKINEGADAMFDAGQKAFPKTWEDRVKAAGEVFRDEIIAKPEFLETITELDNAAAVYHELAGDPDKMEAVLNLPPHRMGMELARISARLTDTPKPKTISKAPAPIKPLDGPTLQERSLEDLGNDPSPRAQNEFFKRMEAEERKRAGAR